MSELRHRLYTAAQVRQLDVAAVQAMGITDHQLMARAGSAAFNAIRAEYPAARHWLVACGSGNNGGDGYVVARLARAAGFGVSVAALAPVAELSGTAATAAKEWLDSGGQVQAWEDACRTGADLVVDALFGTGLSRAPAGIYAEAIDALNRHPGPRIALVRVKSVEIVSGRKPWSSAFSIIGKLKWFRPWAQSKMMPWRCASTTSFSTSCFSWPMIPWARP